MNLLSSFSFASPFLLIALVSLPALYLLLRVTPPSPSRVPFPPLVLIRRMMREESSPARIPLWILILRLLIAAALILAMAEPFYAPDKAQIKGKGPLALYIETGWPVAGDWDLRMRVLASLIGEAQRTERPVILIASHDGPDPTDLISPTAAFEKLRALSPVSYRPARAEGLARLETALKSYADAELVLAFDGLATPDDERAFARLAETLGSRDVHLLDRNASGVIALAGVSNSAEGLKLRLIRSVANETATGRLIAYDAKGRNLGETPFQISGRDTEAQALIALPTDLRNDIARLDIAGTAMSGAVQLLDDSQKRRRIGLVSGTSTDIAQPLLTPDYYLARALEPFADLRMPRQGVAESIATLLDENVAILVLADIGALPPDIETRLQAYLDKGGMVIRFAGPKLASAGTTLLPVKLRGSGRALQGALSWQTPQKLSAFERSSPFHGLAIPDDVTITRQLLAEPDSDLAKKTWAALSDGTPIVTAEARGKGFLVLFHVTADTSWSSLPLSGLYLDMFKRLLPLAISERTERATEGEAPPLQPYRILDGFGRFTAPSATTKPVMASAKPVASADHPAGLYGDASAPYAINSLDASSTIQSINLSGIKGDVIPLAEPKRIDFTAPLIILAALLMAIDGIASLLRGRGHRLASLIGRRGSIAALISALLVINLADGRVHAADISPKDIDGALATRLAYVVTGDASVDEISRQGLESLSRTLGDRTSFEPAEPVGVDLKADDLAIYPLLYWPVTANQTLPSKDAIRRIDRFMKNGGTILFDTRDAALARDGETTPETARLRLILAGLSIPPLEPLPQDHVLTKSFYLIDRIVGRTASGQTWLEALPKSTEGEGPARAGDGVTPIIITSNDLAAAWALDERGAGLLPIDTTMPRQREMALRGGVNIVMYVLTGNYKADQVHVPALLERLGQ